MKLKKSKHIYLLALSIAGIFFFGCSNQELEIPADAPEIEDINVGTNKQEVYLYYGTDESDNEFIPITKEIEIETENEWAQEIMLSLIKTPLEDNVVTFFPNDIKLNAVEIRDHTLYIDFSQEGLHGSSTQESGMIEQIILTFKNNEAPSKSDEIYQIVFLIDGNKAESLMGHIDISNPFELQN